MKTVTILSPAKRGATANGGQTPTSVQSLTRGGKFVLVASNEAGTNPTLDVKIQGSPALARGPEAIGLGDTEYKHRTDTDEAIKIAARFEVDAACSVAKVTLPLKKTGTVAAGTLTLTIEAENSGEDPGGSALGSATAAAADVQADEFGNVEFVFAKPVDLAPGTYFVVLASDVTLSSSNYISWRATLVEDDGNAFVMDSSWSAEDTYDMEFWAEVYQFSDIAELEFEQVTSAAVETLEYPLDRLDAVRAHVTVGGTATPAFHVALLVLGQEEQP